MLPAVFAESLSGFRNAVQRLAAAMLCLRLPLSVASLWLVLSVSCSYKVKHDATSAAGVAQAAFQQGRISQGMLKAMSNVSLLVEAAESSGLAWTHSHAHELVAKAAAHLESREGRWTVSKTTAEDDMTGLQSSLKTFADNKGEVMVLAASSSVGLMTTWLENGQLSFYDAYSVARDVGLALFSMAFPILGQVAALAFTFFEGIFGLGAQGPSPEQQLYEKIMEETQILIDQEFLMDEIGDRMTDMSVLVDEMRWVPTLLNKVHGDAYQHTLLMYYVMHLA